MASFHVPGAFFLSNSVHFSEIQLVWDGGTDGGTVGRTDTLSYRDARTHLKMWTSWDSYLSRQHLFHAIPKTSRPRMLYAVQSQFRRFFCLFTLEIDINETWGWAGCPIWWIWSRRDDTSTKIVLSDQSWDLYIHVLWHLGNTKHLVTN